MRSLTGFAVLMCLSCLSCGRKIHDSDLFGTYIANPDWGTSTLVLNSDHTFTQTVTTKTGSSKSVHGKWELTSDLQTLVLSQKFLSVTHDQQGTEADGDASSVERGLFGGIEISADPDYGIAFHKQ